MVVRHGYNDIVVTEHLGGVVYSELRRHIIHSWGLHAPAITSLTSTEPSNSNSASTTRPTSTHNDELSPDDRKVAKRLEVLDEAYKAQTVYIVGKEQLRLLKTTNNFFKRQILRIFLWIRDNSRAKVASMKIPIEKLVEVGFVKEI
jgi:KUP system potassium uptake protein